MSSVMTECPIPVHTAGGGGLLLPGSQPRMWRRFDETSDKNWWRPEPGGGLLGALHEAALLG